MRKQPEKIHEPGSEQPGGFTLVELIIAAGIMGVVVVGILIGYVRCMELNEVSANKSLATKAARSRMEEIKGTAFAGLATSFNNVAFPVTGFTGMGISYVDSPDTENREVTVSVSWRQKNGRVYGEDKDLDGVLDAGEDLNGNGKLDAPVQIVDRIFQR